MRHPELEGGSATPPRISTGAIDTAPWEKAAIPALEDNQIRQEAIWNEAFNKPENLELVQMNDTGNGDMVLYQGVGGEEVGSDRCPHCLAPYDSESTRFCTTCGKERMQALTNGQQALTNGNNSRRNSDETALAIPGQM